MTRKEQASFKQSTFFPEIILALDILACVIFVGLFTGILGMDTPIMLFTSPMLFAWLLSLPLVAIVAVYALVTSGAFEPKSARWRRILSWSVVVERAVAGLILLLHYGAFGTMSFM